MSAQGTGGTDSLLKAASYSWQGLLATYKHEVAFRQEVLLSIILIPVGFWLGHSGIERALLIGSVVLVIIVELVNSGLEAVTDRFGSEQHELSGRAKDAGSAAVLIALVNVVLIWCLIIFS